MDAGNQGPVRAVVFARIENGLSAASADGVGRARDALERLAARGILVVACSGRTRAEVELMRADLGLETPFATEEGAAVFVPRGYFPFPLPATGVGGGYHTMELSIAHEAVLRSLRRVARQLRVGILSFADMSVGDVARECGLTLLQARLAKLREYDEPFRVVDHDPSARGRLHKALKANGLHVRPGGRFDHVVGKADLGACVSILRALYARRSPVVTLGLGSGPEDLPFLGRVELPVVRPAESGRAAAAMARQLPGATVVQDAGPEAWVEAVELALASHQSPPAARRA
jgi:mannosyl-3-phosphoglycerate phosphatase family protein